MGNSHFKESKRALIPGNPNLNKNYTCYYHKVSSFPDGMERHKCTVLDHSDDKSFYMLRNDADPRIIYNKVPYFFISSYKSPYSWDDYFKVGTIVLTNIKQLTNDTTKFKRAEIVNINNDKNDTPTMDLKDIETGFVVYCVPCAIIRFDVDFYI